MAFVNGNGSAVDIGIDPSAIESAVSDWLDDNPEATSTVADKSLTPAKFSQSAYMHFGDLTDIGRKIASGEITKIDFIGDSVVAGMGGTGYDGNWKAPSPNSSGYCFCNVMRKHLSEQFGCTVVNQGMSGATITDIEKYMDTIFSEGSQCAIYFADINDRENAETYAAFKAKLPGFINTALTKVPYFAVIAQYPTPNDRGIKPFVADAFVSAATLEKCYYGSLQQKWLDYIATNNISGSMSNDGLHPTDFGYYHMFKMVCEMLGIPYDHKTDYSVNGDWWNA